MPLQYPTGQEVRPEFFVPRGYPTASGNTVVVYDAAGEVLYSGAASSNGGLEVTGATRHSREVSVTGTLLPLGLPYWLGADDSMGQQVDMVAHDGASTVWLKEPSRETIAAGWFWSTRLRSTTTLTVSDTRRNCRVVWEWQTPERFGGTIEGAVSAHKTMRHVEIVDFVADPFELSVSERYLEQISEQFGSQLGEVGGALALIPRAEEDIFTWLKGRQVEPDLVKDRRLLTSAAAYRVLQLRHIREADLFERFGELYSKALSDFDASHAWYDKDDDQAAGDADADGLLVEETMPPRYARLS